MFQPYIFTCLCRHQTKVRIKENKIVFQKSLRRNGEYSYILLSSFTAKYLSYSCFCYPFSFHKFQALHRFSCLFFPEFQELQKSNFSFFICSSAHLIYLDLLLFGNLQDSRTPLEHLFLLYPFQLFSSGRSWVSLLQRLSLNPESICPISVMDY